MVVVVVGLVQRSLNVHWQFQEVSRSSVKARCSGRHVLADEGDGAQRQRSGPGVYFGRLLNNARMQLHIEMIQTKQVLINVPQIVYGRKKNNFYTVGLFFRIFMVKIIYLSVLCLFWGEVGRGIIYKKKISMSRYFKKHVHTSL